MGRLDECLSHIGSCLKNRRAVGMSWAHIFSSMQSQLPTFHLAWLGCVGHFELALDWDIPVKVSSQTPFEPDPRYLVCIDSTAWMTWSILA